MPRSIPAGLQARLDGERTTLAFCWEVLPDGLPPLRQTSHDRVLVVDGHSYQPSSGLTPSEVSAVAGGAGEGMEVVGLLDSPAIGTDDLLAGRWDGAAVRVFLCDWTDPTLGIVELLTGRLGEVRLNGGRWEVDLVRLLGETARPALRTMSSSCDVAEFGDTRCGVSLAGLSFSATVTAVTSKRVIRSASLIGRSERFACGHVAFSTGANAGLRRMVKAFSVGSGEVELQEGFPLTVAVGDAFTLTAGCDRTWGSCKAYGNQANFRGFPHLPKGDRGIRVQQR